MSDINDKNHKHLENITFLHDCDFLNYIQQEKLTLLLFLSGVHYECRKQIPLVIDFAQKYGDIYNIAVIDVSRNAFACSACEIESIPQLVITRNGIVLGGRQGGLEDGGEADLLLRLNTMQKMNLETVI